MKMTNKDEQQTLYSQLKAVKEEDEKPSIKDGVINNSIAEIPASLYGERADSQTELEQALTEDYTD